MAQARQILFRIFYSTSFTAFFFVQIIFIAVTPADALYESYKRRRLLDIFLITGAYVVTALISALVYASRLYTNRSVLRDIPKTFMPIEKEDLPGRRIHRLIQECMERSAVIAYQARPRSNRIEHDTATAGARMLALTKSRTTTDSTLEPTWGEIAHPGWASPAAKEMPNLEYALVIDELADLVEAKAVSLAPIDPSSEPGPDGLPLPDPRVIEQLTRSETMDMRAYLRHLIRIGVVPEMSLTVAFLAAYERARFSSHPLNGEDFQTMMRMFAELLRNMTPVEVGLLDLDVSSSFDSSSVGRRHPGKGLDDPDVSSVASTFSNPESVRHHRPPPRRVSEDSVPSLSSAEHENIPDAPEAELATRSRQSASASTTRSRSNPTLQPSPGLMPPVSRDGAVPEFLSVLNGPRSPSRSSRDQQSVRSNGSVIRLPRDSEEGDLPYIIRLP